jgi:ATP-dependent Clp protease ATP-binding subunit ClpA
MVKIVDLQMKEIEERLHEHGINVEMTDKAREWLANEGYDANFGARPLKRTLQKYIESPLSISILANEFKKGDKVLIDLDEKKKEIRFKKA